MLSVTALVLLFIGVMMFAVFSETADQGTQDAVAMTLVILLVIAAVFATWVMSALGG